MRAELGHGLAGASGFDEDAGPGMAPARFGGGRGGLGDVCAACGGGCAGLVAGGTFSGGGCPCLCGACRSFLRASPRCCEPSPIGVLAPALPGDGSTHDEHACTNDHDSFGLNVQACS